jgi:hypothetical protein
MAKTAEFGLELHCESHLVDTLEVFGRYGLAASAE